MIDVHHLIDIYVEDDVVYVDLDQRLSRPLRLSRAEAKALVLGIKLVGHLLAESSALDSVVKKITSHFSASERTYMELAEQSIALAEQGDASAQPLQVLRQAVQMHRLVELKYFSASRGALCDYKVKPLGLLAHSPQGVPAGRLGSEMRIIKGVLPLYGFAFVREIVDTRARCTSSLSSSLR